MNIEAIKKWWPVAGFLLMSSLIGAALTIEGALGRFFGGEASSTNVETCEITITHGSKAGSLDDNIEFLACLHRNTGKVAFVRYHLEFYGNIGEDDECTDEVSEFDITGDWVIRVPDRDYCLEFIDVVGDVEVFSVSCGSPCYEESFDEFFRISRARDPILKVVTIYTLTKTEVPFDVRQEQS